MSARVLYRDSQGRDGQVDLNPAAPLYVGRALDCAIRTDDAMVSRKHSMIRLENGRFYVEDLGSSNGTHVNDIRVTKHPLSHNDVVRCGSLWLRYVEDGPLVVPVAAPARQKPGGGTQRLESAPVGPSAGGYAGQGTPFAGQGSQHGQPFGGGASQHGPAGQHGQAVQHGPAGQHPQGQHGQGQHGGAVGGGGPAGGGHAYGSGYGPANAATPPPSLGPARTHAGVHGGGAPSAGGHPAAGPAGPRNNAGQGRGQAAHTANPAGAYPPLFGGPPAMPPYEGVVGGDLITPARSSGPPIGDEDSIVVDLPEGDPARLRRELDDALGTVESLQVAYDREVADGKRMRAEITTHKDRIEELRRGLVERDEVVEAHNRVADELREELRQAKDVLAATRSESAELSDLVSARDRQLARSQEDIGQLRREIEEKERHLGEVSRTKDEGWRKLNEQLTEIEHLREVINQQERMLEERRVGLISQDEIIKELRADKEQQLRDVAHLKAERDELRNNMGRLQAQVAAIDEENRRLTQLLTELRARRGPRGEEDHDGAAQTAAATAELKSLRIALKTVESDRDHLRGLSERAEGEVEKLRKRVANLEVELREAHDERDRASANKSVADDAMTRAELARHKATEEAMAAAQARQEGMEAMAELRREVDRAHRRIKELEEDTQSQSGPTEQAVQDARVVERKLAEAAETIAALEAEVRTARAERDAAAKKSGRPSGARAAQDDAERTAVVSAARNPAAIKDRAIEVHDGINDVLSELRNNALILHEEFLKDGSERSPDSSRIMKEAIEALLGQAEEAKGVLRRLRELVEFGDE